MSTPPLLDGWDHVRDMLVAESTVAVTLRGAVGGTIIHKDM